MDPTWGHQDSSTKNAPMSNVIVLFSICVIVRTVIWGVSRHTDKQSISDVRTCLSNFNKQYFIIFIQTVQV